MPIIVVAATNMAHQTAMTAAFDEQAMELGINDRDALL
jgi:hypothetical protein